MPRSWLLPSSKPVSFYLGFKGNSSYERLWEARKIWGGIINTSRTWGAFVTTMVSSSKGDDDEAEVQRVLVYRHIAWLAALRIQLRRRKSWEHDRAHDNNFRTQYGTQDVSDERMRTCMKPFLEAEELERVMKKRNRATQLVQHQAKHIEELLEADYLSDFRHIELANALEEFYTLQGKCERIKNFPLPRQYATANLWFVGLFLFVLPLALVTTFDGHSVDVWATIPASIMIGWVFFTWDKILDYSENPFEGLVNDIPMNALSRTIEIDLREMLGETDLPQSVAPQHDILL